MAWNVGRAWLWAPVLLCLCFLGPSAEGADKSELKTLKKEVSRALADKDVSRISRLIDRMASRRDHRAVDAQLIQLAQDIRHRRIASRRTVADMPMFVNDHDLCSLLVCLAQNRPYPQDQVRDTSGQDPPHAHHPQDPPHAHHPLLSPTDDLDNPS